MSDMMERYVIQLNTDIKNPSPDRRSKDWNKKPLVPAGTRFIVQYGALYKNDARYAGEHENSDLAKLIIANSTRVEPETLREIQVVDADYDYEWHSCILESLLAMGRITRQDFRDARDFMNAKYEAEESAKESSNV